MILKLISVIVFALYASITASVSLPKPAPVTITVDLLVS